MNYKQRQFILDDFLKILKATFKDEEFGAFDILNLRKTSVKVRNRLENFADDYVKAVKRSRVNLSNTREVNVYLRRCSGDWLPWDYADRWYRFFDALAAQGKLEKKKVLIKKYYRITYKVV